MSEHWKSTPKYWCKHCAIYVKDTPFERKQHESTGKHHGNLIRFLNGIQKNHAKNEREKDHAKAEVERLNRIAGTGTGTSSSTDPLTSAPSSKPDSKSTKPSSTTLSAADQKRQWAQLAEMGIAAPGNVKADVAMPGDWQVLSRKVVAEEPEIVDDKLNVGVRKRKFQGQEEEEDTGETVVRRGWGSATKTYPGTIPVSDDLDSLLASSGFKKKKSVKGQPEDDTDQLIASAIKSENPTPPDNHVKETIPSPLQEARLGKPHIKSQPSDEDMSSVLDKSEELSIPVFKKRRPKYKQSSGIT